MGILLSESSTYFHVPYGQDITDGSLEARFTAARRLRAANKNSPAKRAEIENSSVGVCFGVGES